MQQYDNDTHWLMALKNGEPAAESKLFERFFRSMCGLAEKITADLPAAQDIVADVFVKCFEQRQRFISIEAIKAFLYISVRNNSYTFTTTRQRHRRIQAVIAAEQGPEQHETTPAMELELLRAELLEEIYQEIENLPGQCRRISKLLFWEGKSTEEIAGLLGISPQTVRTQKARAIQLLKKQLFTKEKFTALLSLHLFLQAINRHW